MIYFRLMIAMFLVCVLMPALIHMPGHAADKIVLAGSQDTKISFHGKWLSLIYTEVFRRLGYELQYNGYPSSRASKISDAGAVDGEINRVTSYQESHPNMIRVDESHFQTTIAAYATEPGIAIDGWNSFKNTDHVVGYRRGTKIVEIGLKSVLKPNKILSATTTEQGLKLLSVGRIDVYVGVEDTVMEILGWLDPVRYDGSSVYTAGILVKTDLHLYLHKKNAALVPKISEILKTMKKEGLINRYRENAKQSH